MLTAFFMGMGMDKEFKEAVKELMIYLRGANVRDDHGRPVVDCVSYTDVARMLYEDDEREAIQNV